MSVHPALILAAKPAPAPGGGGGFNPFPTNGPDITVFGATFNTKWALVMAGIWALSMLVAGAAFLKSWAEYSLAKRMGNEHGLSQASAHVRQAAFGMGGLIAAPIIFGAMVALLS